MKITYEVQIFRTDEEDGMINVEKIIQTKKAAIKYCEYLLLENNNPIFGFKVVEVKRELIEKEVFRITKND